MLGVLLAERCDSIVSSAIVIMSSVASVYDKVTEAEWFWLKSSSVQCVSYYHSKSDEDIKGIPWSEGRGAAGMAQTRAGSWI